MLVHAIVGFLVPPVIEVRDLVTLLLLSWSKPPSHVAVAFIWSMLRIFSLRMWIVVRILGPLRALTPIAARLVETRRGATKRRSFLVQSACWTRAERCGGIASLGVAVTSSPAATLSLRLLQLCVVLSALFRHAKGVVGFADGYESRGGIGVVAVVVGVVLFR